ncbi:hypothetical protein [Phycicoccus sp. HDW14]|uniref:hypothetical protein n=1 Tax=Phycicoccus sp. HDW14 TaxID=2714941 RepID=UPI00140D9755|nr:hypothetical protein [Phycicoccus sp. HDW14]
MRDSGAHAMKFLVQVRADRRPGADGRDTTAEAVQVMRALVADCASVGIPSVIENLIFPLAGEEPLSPRPAPTPSSRPLCSSTSSTRAC